MSFFVGILRQVQKLEEVFALPLYCIIVDHGYVGDIELWAMWS